MIPKTSLVRRYPLAPSGVFWTLQGEGRWRGCQMAFVRLAGCSVGCPNCDTDYRVAERLTVDEVVDRVAGVVPEGVGDRWVWVTGGEPTDHPLAPLLEAFMARGYFTALATSGVRRVEVPVDWLSVSPHGADPTALQQYTGSEFKLVDGLNGLDLDQWWTRAPDRISFAHRYVQPLWVGDAATGGEDPASLARCLDFLRRHPRWALSRQDHKGWGVP